MIMSKMFGRTIREVPAEAEIDSHKLLLRAGLVRKMASGIYQYDPLAWRSMKKIQEILRSEMDGIGAQEINMPLAQPAELWQESGRWYSVGPEMARFKDRSGRDMVLAITHEEAVTDLVRNEINSYKQLPLVLYQIQMKFRDEARPRAGLIRVREFYMKDAYSFHRSEEDLDAYYEVMMQAYFRIFHRAGLNVITVKSDNGNIGGKISHEYMYVTPIGEDSLILCDQCGYAANQEVAETLSWVNSQAEMLPLQEVFTPGSKTIAQVAAALEAEPQDCMKALFYVSKGQLIMIAIRGDLELNELKLKKTLDDANVRLASEEEAIRAGIVPGYASPIGFEGRILVDASIAAGRNWIAGANKAEHHLRNVNLGRDFKAEGPYDLVSVKVGALCPVCGSPLKEARGVEVGNIFKLGTKYSSSMKATFLDENGENLPLVMGCYGIGLGRLLSCAIEEHHDEAGIIWPMTLAPYHVYLCSVGGNADVVAKADELYQEMLAAGIEVLYDDRDLRPGVKFNDADLIGLPIRVIVSARSLAAGQVELKERKKQEAVKLSLQEAIPFIQNLIQTELVAWKNQ